MNASPVRSFGKYLLDDEIARGGMSRVFLARLRGLGGFEKRLVVKQVLPELASDPRFISMFVQEAKTLVRMSHPHIAPVYELGVVDGVYFLAMEYVDGATLSQILKNGPLAPELVAHLGAQISSALHYAHARFSIVHRDVTPRNVIVDEEGHARLLDFGIAAPVTGEAGDGLFGTPGYLSPEQANGSALGPRTDVFSLGAVLFEALTARQAFFARNVDEAREVLTMEGPDFYPDDGVPETLMEIVENALERDPEQRPRSARDLGRSLRSWLATHAPEGVGPELGDRVRDAGRDARASHVEAEHDATPSSTEGKSDGEVKTLATSQFLDDLLERATPIKAPALRAVSPREDESDDGPRTLAISRPSAPAEADEDSDAVPDADSDESPAAMWPLAALFAGLAIATVVAITWPAGAPGDPTPPEVRRASHEDPDVIPPSLEQPPPEQPPPEQLPPEQPPPERPPPETHHVTDTPRVPAPERALARARLTVNAEPWADVELDGRPIGRTPIRRRNISAGRHTLILRNPNLGRPIRTTFEATPRAAIVLIGNPETGSLERR